MTMQLTIKTSAKTEMINITGQVQEALDLEHFHNGICMVYVPHTTAAVTINESADPNVTRDILMILNKVVPWQADYRHIEGNSPAHIKASLMGASVMLAVEKGRLLLGTWQGIFFCEFDGPRTRKAHLKLLSNEGSILHH
ncbi:MAG: YjbQ family protein [Desulfobacteraceae bacterium]|nr:YjbQ family protein [Desulfobacteraceae bacterium]